jgi:predicted DNA-binding transcriptional regulator AlpA
MKNDVFKLTSVKPMDGLRLRLRYADGATFEVSLDVWIAASKALAALKKPVLFMRAHVGEGGHSVAWVDDELELGADNLRNLAVEQAGGIGHECIWEWMHRNKLTLDAAAEALGISRRMIAYYRNGQKTIPRHVWLACMGWEALNMKRAA